VEEVHRKRFIREARIISQLEHPNTVRILDFGTTGTGHLYYVMEYLKGQSLQAALTTRRFCIADTIHVARQLGKALAEAHARGIVHRDLKPANIYLKTVYGEPLFTKLLDFGIARDYEDAASETLTHAGFVVGTIRYMAPEQGRAEPLDGRADLYSLGCVMTEMLVGLARQDSDISLISQLRRLAQGVPPEPFTVDSNDPRRDALTHLILQCRDPNPAMRPADAEAFVDRLDSLGNTATVGSVPEPTIMIPSGAEVSEDETILFPADNAPLTITARPQHTDYPPPSSTLVKAPVNQSATIMFGQANSSSPSSQQAVSRERNSPSSRPILVGLLVICCAFGGFLLQQKLVQTNPNDTKAETLVAAGSVVSNQDAPNKKDSIAPNVVNSTSATKPATRPSLRPQRTTPAPEPNGPPPLPALAMRAREHESASQTQLPISNKIAPYLRQTTLRVVPQTAIIRQKGKALGNGSVTVEWRSNEPGPQLTLQAKGYRTKTIKLDNSTPGKITITLRKAAKASRKREFYPLPQ
jgi:serine/threonine-protein kinase